MFIAADVFHFEGVRLIMQIRTYENPLIMSTADVESTCKLAFANTLVHFKSKTSQIWMK